MKLPDTKQNYETPLAEVASILVEAGFAQSPSTTSSDDLSPLIQETPR